jgi:hypothetical protein
MSCEPIQLGRLVLVFAVVASCVGVANAAVRGSGEPSRTHLIRLDRSRELSHAERRAIDRELPGKTPLDVIHLLGRPDNECSLGKGHLRLTYWLGQRGNLKIDFQNGLVTSVAHNAWQTGVREDDFVGEVKP